MFRRLFLALSVLSLAVAILIGFAYVQARRGIDYQAFFAPEHGDLWMLKTGPQRLVFVRGSNWTGVTDGGLTSINRAANEGGLRPWFLTGVEKPGRLLPLHLLLSTSSSKLAMNMDGTATPANTGVAYVYFDCSLTLLRVPYPVAAAPFLILPGLWLLAYAVRVIRRRRLRPGHCTACGYDLRATPDKCPECGHVPTPTEVDW